MDFGYFTLSGQREPDPADLESAGNGAISNDAGIDRAGLVLAIRSPHQNNFEMALTVELWSTAAPDDHDDWEIGLEASIEVVDGLTYGSPTMEDSVFPVPPGTYRVLVTGVGFREEGWPGTTTPGDTWRVQCSPIGHAILPRQLWDGRAGFTAPPVTVQDESDDETQRTGVAAAQRLSQKLLAGNAVSGRTGVARAQGAISTPLVDSLRQLSRPIAWLTGGGSMTDTGFRLRGYGLGYEDLIVPMGIIVVCDDLPSGPNSVCYTWQWIQPPDAELSPRFRRGAIPGPLPAGLRDPSVITATAAPVPRRGCLINIEHSGVAAEWADDLASYWRWQILRLASHY